MELENWLFPWCEFLAEISGLVGKWLQGFRGFTVGIGGRDRAGMTPPAEGV